MEGENQRANGGSERARLREKDRDTLKERYGREGRESRELRMIIQGLRRAFAFAIDHGLESVR